MTRKNLEALEFENSVKLTCSSIAEYDPPVAPNFVITDPPYGIRLSKCYYFDSIKGIYGICVQIQREMMN